MAFTKVPWIPPIRGMATKPQASVSCTAVLPPLLSWCRRTYLPPLTDADHVVRRFRIHMMAVVDRLDQEICDQADEQKSRQNAGLLCAS